MEDHRNSAIFGRRNEAHQITIVHNGKIRKFTIESWTAGFLVFCGLCMTLGLAGSLSYIALRDDFTQSLQTTQSGLEIAYENRISLLRVQIDRMSSRRLIEKEAYRNQLNSLLKRQDALESRSRALVPLFEQAIQTGLPGSMRPPKPGPQRKASDNHALLSSTGHPNILFANAGLRTSRNFADLQGEVVIQAAMKTNANSGKNTHSDIHNSVNPDLLSLVMSQHENAQIHHIAFVTRQAQSRIDSIRNVIANAGLPAAMIPQVSATGGPYVPLNIFDKKSFSDQLIHANRTLNVLAKYQNHIRNLPLANPLSKAKRTSKFGPRIDPFYGKLAMHSGIDFAASRGTPVLAAGGGTVLKASRSGGYGLLIELDHGNNITSRYAHLSTLNVIVGDTVETGEMIGRVGSTGRSTGPHLHYETRLQNKAFNPDSLFRLGIRASQFL